LYCLLNSLTSLNVSQNTSLKELYCNDNLLTTLDVSNNTLLERFDCFNNSLTSLDVTQNNKLDSLDCSSNMITSLELFTPTGYALSKLDCSDNLITSIDKDKQPLDYLYCSSNLLTSLEVSWRLRELDCSNNQISALDLTENTILEKLLISSNSLSSLNLKNGKNYKMVGDATNPGLDATNNPDLNCIQVDDSASSYSYQYWYKDVGARYSENCGSSYAVEDNWGIESDISVYPNPCSGSTRLRYHLPRQRQGISDKRYLISDLYSISGKWIKRLLNEEMMPGEYEMEIDVRNLPPGIYFIRMQAGEQVGVQKLVVME